MSFSFITKSPVRSKALKGLLKMSSPPQMKLNVASESQMNIQGQKHACDGPDSKSKTWDDFFSSSFDEASMKSALDLDDEPKGRSQRCSFSEFSSPEVPVRREFQTHVLDTNTNIADLSWSKFEDEDDSQDIIKAHQSFVESFKEEGPVLEHEVKSEDRRSIEDPFKESALVESQRTSKRVLSPQKPSVSNMAAPLKRTKPLEQIRHYSSKSTKDMDDNYTLLLQTQQQPKEQRKQSFKPAKIVKPMVLSPEQEFILKLVKQGVSLFYTGSAGTGKSVLLRTIIKSLRKQHPKGAVAVTASTGLAACNIGGITLHSFAGVGLGAGTVDSLIKKVKKNRKAVARWKEVRVLIIDEISMIDGKFFNALDGIARKVRRNNSPFGGIQLIVCGDFYQLPPVSKHTNIDGTDVKEKVEAMFAFESESWKEAIQKTLVLKEVFRQKGDQTFIDMLNEMRSGYVSDANNQEFKKLSRPLEMTGGIEPAQLYCTRAEVERANNHRLNLLKGSTYLYKAKDSGTLPTDQRQHVLANFLTPEKLFLKVGAQVMCIKNFDETLVNGSLGQVIAFIDRDTYMNYKIMEEEPERDAEEIESKAKATNSKRKEKKEDDDIESEKLGQASQDSLNDSIFDFLEDVDVEVVEDDSLMEVAYKTNVHRKKELIKKLHETSTQSRYPLVRFLLPDGNHRTLLVEPETWTIEDENENVLAKRVQIPLILAWSLSIHKSQGQTLPRVKVDLRRVFENGQAYVALSRAISREGLQIMNFDRSKVKAHPKVNQFYSSLSSAAEVKKQIGGQQKLNFGRLDDEDLDRTELVIQ